MSDYLGVASLNVLASTAYETDLHFTDNIYFTLSSEEYPSKVFGKAYLYLLDQ